MNQRASQRALAHAADEVRISLSLGGVVGYLTFAYVIRMSLHSLESALVPILAERS